MDVLVISQNTEIGSFLIWLKYTILYVYDSHEVVVQDLENLFCYMQSNVYYKKY